MLTESVFKDTTTQMIETIWPLSILSCGQDTELGNKQQNLIGLRTFVQEVLRRSKTSYSTLQVALYYLILVQSCIPKHDFTMEQSEDSPACRAMQCGRRMFLAALILASKYLQDRNFSARAWSKISGLGTCEINANEMAFLRAVDWKLHIPEPVFHRWTDIVLKYSPSAQFNTPPRSSPRTLRCWKTIIPMLTPDLDTVEFGHAELSETDSGYDSPGSDMSPPPIPMHEDMSTSSGSNEPTPTNPYTIPRVLEPTPRDTNTNEQILPPLPKLGPLPTPQLTPRTGAFCTPAVSASGLCPKRPSMCYAMGRIQDSVFARTTLDRVCDWKPKVSETFPTPSRRPSLARSASSMSSPESMISDRSSRSSRSSSISSIASSNCALQQPRLAVQATRRCANMHLSDLKEENQPAIICESPGVGLSWEEFTAKHEPNKPKPVILVGAREILESTRRAMAESQRNISTCEAAAALRDMRLNRRSMVSQPTPPETPRSRKRSRTSSIDLSLPSAAVSAACDLLAPRCLGDITNMKKRNEEDKTVLPDENVADSFLLRDEYRGENTTLSLPPFDTYKRVKPSTAKPLMSQEGLPNKRTCAGSDRGGRDEARMIERLMRQSDGMSRPGMWAGRL